MTEWKLHPPTWRRLIADLPDSQDGNRLFRDIHQHIARYRDDELVKIRLTEHEQGLIGYSNLCIAKRNDA